MGGRFEMALTAVLWVALVILPFAAGALGALVSVCWLGGGLYMVANSRSRGFLADASFMVTWPIYIALNR